MFATSVLAADAAQIDRAYRLGTGDHIVINVFQEEDLTLEVRISDSGTVSYPLLGELKVKNLTIGQLEDKITRGLKDGYLINPRVTVSVNEYRQFFVNGEVKKPGAYPYVPGLTVGMAISIAGGFEERADENNLRLQHENSSEGAAKKVSIDGRMQPGDILTVKQSFF